MNMRKVLIFALISALIFISCGKDKGPATDLHIFLIGIDGLSNNGLKLARTPNLDRLVEEGVLVVHNRGVMPTVSKPNWAAILTGVGPEQNSVVSNDWTIDNHPFEPVGKDESGHPISLFNVLEDAAPELRTAMFYDWKELTDFLNLSKIDHAELLKNTAEDFQKVINYIWDSRPNFCFIYFGIVDEVGHQYGWESKEYLQAIELVDSCIGQLLKLMEKEGLYEKSYFIVVSDHGGVGKGHGGVSLAEIETPLIIAGPATAKNKIVLQPVNNFDVASTVLYLFGIEQPSYWLGKPISAAFEQ